VLVLGIDPGLGKTGYGLVRAGNERDELVESGVVETPPGGALPARLSMIYDGMTGLIERTRPDQAAVEQLFYSRNVSTAVAVAQARGVVLLACERAGIAVFEYHPTQVKRALSGFGHAGKGQMGRLVAMILRLPRPPEPDDAADAVAIALVHLQTPAAKEKRS
jgi:crossover junction endodeoxyribonuclease RuvC